MKICIVDKSPEKGERGRLKQFIIKRTSHISSYWFYTMIYID